MKGIAAALAALAVIIVPATAEAATYEVQLCADPLNTGFVAGNGNPGVFAMTATCPPVANQPFSGLYLGVKPGVTAPRGTTAGWTLRAPEGTSFDTVVTRFRFEKADSGYELRAQTSAGQVAALCAAWQGCDDLYSRTHRRVRAVTWDITCAAETCGNSPGTRLAIESARAIVDDPEPPVIAAAAKATWQRTPAVAVSAADASGIASLTLKTAGRTVGSDRRACDYRHLQPCPDASSAMIAVDLPDGTYPIAVEATDAAGQSATAPAGTLMLDRAAPGPLTGLTVKPGAGGMYTYTWTNPDQGGAAPIAAARLSDGTVVRGANIQTLESASPVERIHLEDEAGNADPAMAVGITSGAPLQLQSPILQSTTPPRVKLTSAKRSGPTLVVKGTVSNASGSKITATVKRGARTAKKSATVRRGRFTVRIALSSRLRRSGTITLTVRHGTATATKRLRF